MSTIASRVAARIIAMEQETALDLSDIIQRTISADINWSWDMRNMHDLPSFGFHDKKFSFPGRPGAFDTKGILGGIHIEGKLSGDPAPGTSVTADLTGAYYNKNKHGGGELSRHKKIGTFDIEFDQNGKPSFTKGQNTTTINSVLQSIIDDIASNPPDNALSTSKVVLKKLEKQKRLDDMNLREEERRREERDEGIDTHGTIDHFVKYIKEENDGVFGPRDVARLNEILQMTQRNRPNRTDLLRELNEKGLTYNQRKLTVSSNPSDIANKIRLVALEIESLTQPSRSKIATEIRNIMISMTTPQDPEDEEFSDNEEYIREQQERRMLGDYDEREDYDDEPPVRPF